MANGESSSTPRKTGAVAADDVLRQILNKYPSAAFPTLQDAAAGAAPESKADSKGAIVGGDEDRKRPRRTREGKSRLHGADRVVKVYKITEAELDRIGDLSRDESAARAWAAFCLGLFVDVIFGLIFATGLSATSKTAASVIAIFALLGMGKFGWDAHKKRQDGKSALSQMKDNCDFENA